MLLTAALLAQQPGSSASLRTPNKVTNTRKEEFKNLLKTLPTDGEFYTQEAIVKAEPFLPVLLALDEKDLPVLDKREMEKLSPEDRDKYDMYPFLAIIRGLCDGRQNRGYVVSHFKEIRHPFLKLAWAALLFDANSTSPEVVHFLTDALQSDQQRQLLKDMLGPGFDDFRKRLLAVKTGPPAN